jgi:hypothetical protein
MNWSVGDFAMHDGKPVQVMRAGPRGLHIGWLFENAHSGGLYLNGGSFWWPPSTLTRITDPALLLRVEITKCLREHEQRLDALRFALSAVTAAAKAEA